jgi:hypothetical protein
MGQFEGYGLQPVHKPGNVHAGFSPRRECSFKLTHYGLPGSAGPYSVNVK